MALPVTIPNTFANATSSIPLSQLDANFSTLANAVNGINSGAETLANLKASNVTITGGIISNVTLDNVTVSVETLANVTITDSLIVTANTASDAVRITQIGTGNALVVEDSTNPDSTPFVIDATGKVAIGSTSTQTYSTSLAITPNFQVNAAGGATSGISRFSANSSGNSYWFLKSRGATIGAFDVVASGDTLGTIGWLGADGTDGIQAATILAAVDGTPGTNDMPGRLVFSTTADGASTPTERYRIASDGKHTYTGYAALTNSTNNDAFTITNTGTGNSFVVEDSTSPDSTPFVITGTGNILKGTSTSYSFGASTAGFQSHSVSGDVAGLGLVSWQTGSNTAASLWFGRGDSGVVGNFSDAVDGNDVLGNIRFQGSDGTAFVEAAIIKAEVDGTPGTNDMPGRLVFSTTADGSSSPTERMRIDSAGNVGIGVTPPAGRNFILSTNITGATTSVGNFVNGTVQSDVTSNVRYFQASASTAAASFTLPELNYFLANQGTFGLGSTVTTQIGFHANNSITGATNNYGFYSGIASGTGRWNFYAAGTAENYLGGNLKIGGTADRGTTAGTNHLSLFNGTAPAGTLTNGVTLYSSSGDLNFMNSAGNGFKVGYRNIPAVGTKTGSYTLAVGDVGKYVQVGSGGSITIPDATFAEGDVVSVFNNTSGNITITCSITTAYIAGTDADKASVTLATRGVATILFISGTVCVISGNVS